VVVDHPDHRPAAPGQGLEHARLGELVQVDQVRLELREGLLQLAGRVGPSQGKAVGEYRVPVGIAALAAVGNADAVAPLPKRAGGEQDVCFGAA
jgi:hypothetical protein